MITNLGEVTESRLCWPDSKPRAAQRVGSPFKTEAGKASKGIEYEMEQWRIRAYIISRNNQRIFAGDPAAAVWWVDRRGELRVLACDKYQKLADNLHAIELTLEAMRALERWGAYTAEQAIEGARPALPPPPAGERPADWRSILGFVSGLPKDKQLVLCEHTYRSLAREAAGDQGRLRELNLAIGAARKDLTA